MSGLDTALGDRVRYQEEIEAAVNNFTLFNETLINVGTLRRIVNESLVLLILGLLEEALTHALIDNDQGDLGPLSLVSVVRSIHAILFSNDGIELLELKVDDLLAHGITDTITVDEDVSWHLAAVEVAIGSERALEIVREHAARDDFLAFLRLGGGLGVVLAHEWVISRAETNCRLLALVANVDTHKHGLVGDFWSELHAPEITTEFGVHLTDDVQEDAIIVLLNGAIGNKLRDNWRVAVDLILQERVEVLVIRLVGHDNQEDELRMSNFTVAAHNDGEDLLIVVVLDRLCETFKQDFLVVGGLV